MLKKDISTEIIAIFSIAIIVLLKLLASLLRIVIILI